MSDLKRAEALRSARNRALARLRAEFDERYQELMDEEVALAGLPPRQHVQQFQPRSTWQQERP